MSDKQMSVMPEPRTVSLGPKTYEVKPMVWGKVFKLKRLLQDTLARLDKALDFRQLFEALRNTESNTIGLDTAKVLEAVDVLLEQPVALIQIGIPDVDPLLFAPDTEDGATVPEVLEAIGVILEVNHLGVLKNRIWEAANRLFNNQTTNS